MAEDPAIKSHPFTSLDIQPPLLVEWSKFPAYGDRQREERIHYVQRELERAQANGISPLFAAITLPLASQQDDAFAALQNMGLSTVTLRLVQGCTVPHTDPQGRQVPESKRGKVLFAKVGNSSHASGPLRSQAALREQPIYNYREIGPRPVALPLDQAISVMRTWGYGVRPKRVQRKDGPPRRDEWLVVHVQDDGQPYSPVDSDPPAQGRGARSRQSSESPT